MLIRFATYRSKTSLATRLITSVIAVAGMVGLAGCDNAQSRTPAKSETQKLEATNSSAPAAKNESQLQQLLAANLAKSGITAKITSVTATSMPNIYWVKAEGLPAFFTDAKGQYVVQGDIIKVGGAKPEHISANLQAQDAKASLATIDKKDMIIFPAKGQTKAAIYVFTDADCGYCRKFHSEIDEVNALGIEVRYLPWPRSEQTMPIMEKIWCSSDRKKALTDAKLGLPINAPTCSNPVRKIYELGANLGINGTPAVFDTEGHQLGGYVPPAELAQALNLK
ncbi:DsbC family protein [Moraxella sp. CTOTU49803]|uniref:DsbC family protein n=1 Tax=Moraxella sp. CTOTU49803 TaxID=2953840 RepID=UPI0028B120D9|nr:DsbC family protein [Moraxella sp. CTOTU49803]